jgi:hypothetical protein
MRLSLATLVLLLTLAPSALALQPATSSTVDVAQALRSDPVYLDPGTDTLSSAEADALRRQIASGRSGPVFIAILPESAGDVDQVARALAGEVGRRGTYIVAVGGSVRAGALGMPFRPGTILERELDRGGSPAEVLSRTLDGIASLNATGGGGSGDPAPGPDGSGSLVLLGALALGGGAFALSRRARRRREDKADLEAVKEQVRDDLVDLGDGIRALDLDVEMPGVDPAAREDYGRAVAAYDRANTAWNTARTVYDLEPVGSALEEGRWALQSAKARLEGRTPPQRTPPCFFDPRHGPSHREVEWAPPGGTPRPVPACEADAQRVERGDDPRWREIEAHGQMVPYWAAGPAYSPFYGGGMFGGFGGLGLAGGLLGGLMLGEMLDGPDVAYADPGFGGDFGGGDFGGGDFGGGDFGGGDFGGGDF